MPDARLSVEVGAKIDGLTKGMSDAQKSVAGFAASADQTINKVGVGFAKGSNQAAFALQNLGRVAQDVPFGFIGIQNNLNPLLESFQQLRKDTGSNSAAFTALRSTLMGPAGIGIALSVISSAILLYQMYQRSANKETKEAADKNKELADSILTLNEVEAEGRKNAAKDLSSLEQMYKLTQNLTIPQKERLRIAKELIEQYPDYLGKFTAEKILAGEAAAEYVKLTDAIRAKGLAQAGEKNRALLLEQELNINKEIAREEAKLAKAEKDRRELVGPTKVLYGGEFGEIVKTESQKATDAISKLNKELEINQKEIKLVDDVTTKLVATYGSVVTTGDFGKTLKEKKDKVAKDVKTIADVFKELSTDLKQAESDITGTFTDQQKRQVSAYNTAIKALIELGVNPASMAIQNLKDQASEFDNTIGKASFDTKLEKSMRFMHTVQPKIMQQTAEKSTEAMLSPLQEFNNYIGTTIFPQLETGFNSFFNNILENGKFSFDALGSAIMKTFTSVLASEATKGILSLLNPAQTQLQKGGTGKGLFGLIGGLLGGGGGTAAGGAGVAATGGLLLPILGGIAAGGLIASLFKKRDRAPDPVYATNGVSTPSSGSAGNSVIHVIMTARGRDLVGTLNLEGFFLSRVQNGRG